MATASATFPVASAADRRKGYLITLLGVLWLSPDALVLRLIDSDPMDVLGWRGGLSAIVLCIFLCFRDGIGALASAYRQGWRLLVLATCYGLNTIFFVTAISWSSAADVLVILAATPVIAAAMGWFLLAEKPAPRTMLAIALGGVGVLVAAAGGVGTGSLAGMFSAVMTTTFLALQFTLLRFWPQVDNVMAVILGSVMVAILSFAVADPLSIEGTSRLWATLLGVALTPVAFTLVMIGPRYLSAAEVSLMMLLETALGPLWVWMALGEEPSLTALIGGVLIVAAVTVAASSAFRRTA